MGIVVSVGPFYTRFIPISLASPTAAAATNLHRRYACSFAAAAWSVARRVIFCEGFILAHSHRKADNAKVHDEIEIVRANLVRSTSRGPPRHKLSSIGSESHDVIFLLEAIPVPPSFSHLPRHRVTRDLRTPNISDQMPSDLIGCFLMISPLSDDSRFETKIEARRWITS
jgi:hypothetical protein